MSPVVVRSGRMYLNDEGFFRAHCVEDAMQFDSPGAAQNYCINQRLTFRAIEPRGIDHAEELSIEFYSTALAREDAEYADQLRELRS